jgi:hypothetical protein
MQLPKAGSISKAKIRDGKSADGHVFQFQGTALVTVTGRRQQWSLQWGTPHFFAPVIVQLTGKW